MKFSKLADYLKQLDETSSRNKLTEILSQLFGQADVAEIDKICYLVLGRIAPSYTGIEFNLAERMMLRAIALAYNLELPEVTTTYKAKGDLGDVVEEVMEKTPLRTRLRRGAAGDLTVSEVYNKLYEIAIESGKGSQERKLSKFSDLLKSVEILSAKYIVRIPVGKLRLGFSDATILDALSLMEKGDKSARREIENAFNVVADIGKIAVSIKQHGLKSLEKIHATPGVPIRASLADRIDSAAKIIEKVGPKVAVEPKYDGFRCISGYTPIYTQGRGYISVKDIKVGDYVLTHMGRFKKVLAVNKRVIEKNERLFKFKTFLGDEFKISEGHRVLVSSVKGTLWKPVEKIQKGDEVVFPKVTRNVTKNTFVPNPHLILQDAAGYKKVVETGDDFYRFLGFWMGDGFTNEHHNTERVGLIFNHLREKELASEYKRLVTKVFKISNISENIHNGGLYLYWRDTPLKNWLSRHFRREWKGKMVPEWFFDIGKREFQAFLKGWIESDGTPRNSGGYKITTKERDLAAAVQLLGISHGIVLGLRKIRVISKVGGFVGTYYEVIVPGTERYVRVEKDQVLVKVLKKEEIKKPDSRIRLYNLQVEDDESYCTGMVALHNCQIHIAKDNSHKEVSLFSRNNENVTAMFPDIVEAAESLKVKSAIFDGEAIGYNPKTGEFYPFQETVQRKRKHGIAEAAKNIPLKVFVFDVLYLDGKDLMQEPFSKRREVLEKVLTTKADTFNSPESNLFILTKQIVTSSPEKLRAMFDEYMDDGLEGIMAKKLDVAYKAGGRGFHWVKFKKHTGGALNDTIDCVLMGAFYGRGKRAGFGVGGFLLGVLGSDDNFYTISNLGTGVSDEQFKHMKGIVEGLKSSDKPKNYVVDKIVEPDIWVKPEVVLEILADEITSSPRHTAGRDKSGKGYSLRFPRLIKIRDDKNPEDATTVKEIEKLYKMQRKK